MNILFSQHRQKLFTLKAMREGRGVPVPSLPQSTQPSLTKCPHCGHCSSKKELLAGLYVCGCGHHYPIGAYYRLSLLLDAGSFQELNEKVEPQDVLQFPGYPEKIIAQQKHTGLRDAVVTALGTVNGLKAVFAVMDSRFFMGSMGTAVGEKIARAVEYAEKKRTPLIIFTASGGARMQEGMFSLLQMAKTSAALARFHRSGGLYIAYLTHPTTGGVTASFASLGDITLAEPAALIGFAGPRVIEQTIGEKLPEGFQRAEYVEECGFLDQIVPRSRMRETLAQLLTLHQKGGGRR